MPGFFLPEVPAAVPVATLKGARGNLERGNCKA